MPGSFRVGWELEVTVNDQTHQGEVMAFDSGTNLLMMKRPVPGQRNSWDITLVNRDYVQDVTGASQVLSLFPP